jgi:hypothetical protein
MVETDGFRQVLSLVMLESTKPTWCKRGRGTATTPGNLSIATVPLLP